MAVNLANNVFITHESTSLACYAYNQAWPASAPASNQTYIINSATFINACPTNLTCNLQMYNASLGISHQIFSSVVAAKSSLTVISRDVPLTLNDGWYLSYGYSDIGGNNNFNIKLGVSYTLFTQ